VSVVKTVRCVVEVFDVDGCDGDDVDVWGWNREEGSLQWRGARGQVLPAVTGGCEKKKKEEVEKVEEGYEEQAYNECWGQIT
jgi:hypothetical protein